MSAEARSAEPNLLRPSAPGQEASRILRRRSDTQARCPEALRESSAARPNPKRQPSSGRSVQESRRGPTHTDRRPPSHEPTSRSPTRARRSRHTNPAGQPKQARLARSRHAQPPLGPEPQPQHRPSKAPPGQRREAPHAHHETSGDDGIPGVRWDIRARPPPKAHESSRRPPVRQLQCDGKPSLMAQVAEKLDALPGARHVSVVDTRADRASLAIAEVRSEARIGPSPRTKRTLPVSRRDNPARVPGEYISESTRWKGRSRCSSPS
jgi:hypothetical protein